MNPEILDLQSQDPRPRPCATPLGCPPHPNLAELGDKRQRCDSLISRCSIEYLKVISRYFWHSGCNNASLQTPQNLFRPLLPCCSLPSPPPPRRCARLPTSNPLDDFQVPHIPFATRDVWIHSLWFKLSTCASAFARGARTALVTAGNLAKTLRHRNSK